MTMINSPAPTGSAALRGNLYCALSMFIWACGFPASEMLLANWDPVSLSTARLVLAVAVLIPVWMLVDGPRTVLRARWGRGAIVGGIGFGIGSFLLLLGQAWSDPVSAAIVAATMPLIGMALEVLLDGRRLRATLLLGLALSVLGGVITAGTNINGVSSAPGALVVFVSVIVFTWGSREIVRAFPELSPIGQTTISLSGALFMSAIILFSGLALGFDLGPRATVDRAQILNLVIFAVLAMSLSQLFWIRGVGSLGIGLAAFHVNLTPFWVMLFMVALGGSWLWGQALGAGVVALGVVIAQMRGFRWPVSRQIGRRNDRKEFTA